MLENFKKVVLSPRATEKQIRAFFWILLSRESQKTIVEALGFLEQNKPDLSRALAKEVLAAVAK